MAVNPDDIIGIALFTALLGGGRDYCLMAAVAPVPIILLQYKFRRGSG